MGWGWNTHDVEHEEAGSDGKDGSFAVGGETIGNGSHGVLADTPVDVPTRVVAVDAARRSQVGLLLLASLIIAQH
jgi:hypothetical protein